MFKKIFFAILTMISARASAHTIAVCEVLVVGDPYLSERFKQDYEQSANLAFHDFRINFPSSDHKIRFCLEAKNPETLLSNELLNDSRIIVGFSFTSGSKVAFSIANQAKKILLTPTASLDELFTGTYAMSHGTPFKKVTDIISSLINDDPKINHTEIFSPFGVAYSSIQKNLLVSSIKKPILQHEYIQPDADMVGDFSQSMDESAIVFTSYAFHHFKTLMKIIKSPWNPKVFGTSQWGFNQDLLRLTVKEDDKINLNAVSDFIDIGKDLKSINIPKHLTKVFSDSSKISRKFALDFEKNYHRRPEPFSYAIYDAVYTALLIAERFKSNAVLEPSKISLGWQPGVSGPAEIKNGIIFRPTYHLQWETNRFIPRRMIL